VTRIVFVAAANRVPPRRDDTVVVVTDTAWTPRRDDRSDVIGLRPVIAGIVETVDLFEEALALLDRWADESDAVDRLMVGSVSMWHSIRETLWRWLHERLLWALVVTDLVERYGTLEVEDAAGIPALDDVLMARPDLVATVPRRESDPPGATARAAPGRDQLLGRLVAITKRTRRLVTPGRGPVGLPRDDVARLEARIRAMAEPDGRGILVLRYGRVAQVIGDRGETRLADPHLDAVVGTLETAGWRPIILALGVERDDPVAADAVKRDPRLLPGWLLSARWGKSGTARPAGSQVDDPLEGRDTPRAPLLIDQVDLGPAVEREVRRLGSAMATAYVRLGGRVDAMLEELRPAAMLLTHEGIRTAWIASAERHGIPTFAVQHGVIYPTHPGYRHVATHGVQRPTVTFVYGPYERRVLLDYGGYDPDSVVVSGSPRLDLDSLVQRGGLPDQGASEREAVRTQLGVAAGDRLLVVSTLFEPFVRWSHFTHMLDRLLGGPLPRVHVVFKLHPGETDDGPYRALVEGTAIAREYEPPPISVVRDIDLLRLLRAADAHLGLFSTVLTDAVVAGAVNLIATVEAHEDLIGYIPANVARPVGSPTELLAALDDPWPVDAEARRGFLEDHFRPGDASGRIAEEIGRRSSATIPIAGGLT